MISDSIFHGVTSRSMLEDNMPVKLLPIGEDDKWSGAQWIIDNEEALAVLIGRVALGQSRHVVKILKETDGSPHTIQSALAGAQELLSAKTEKEAEHRDGWMFQVISWIAAYKESPEAIIKAPHIIKADKGFDGLLVEQNDSGIQYVVICEDKATINPRTTVRAKVWPEFKDFQSGARDNQLVEAVTSLIEQRHPEDADDIVAKVFWDEQRAYRVAVTGKPKHSKPKPQKKLFKGFEVVVPGQEGRRRAHVLSLAELRPWMSSLAEQALDFVEAECSKDV